MKNRLAIIAILVPFFTNAQVTENFEVQNKVISNEWIGVRDHFIINDFGELQSNASTTSISYLTHSSEAIENASWECEFKINYTTSSSNYAQMVVISDQQNITDSYNGYFVMVGGTNDEICLYKQNGTQKIKIIDGIDKRTDGNPINIKIQLKRDDLGNFSLYSRKINETEYILEGETLNSDITKSKYMGIVFSNTSTTGKAYCFDNIIVTGQKMTDLIEPTCTNIECINENEINVSFSENIILKNSSVYIDEQLVESTNLIYDEKNYTVKIITNVERGKIHSLKWYSIEDEAGNKNTAEKEFAIVEKIEKGDVIINEVMFEEPLNGVEYIELYNKSNKVVQLNNICITSRKTDGNLNSGNKINFQKLWTPEEYIVICEFPDSLSKYYELNNSSAIAMKWYTLNNEKGNIIICDELKQTIYDELNYDKSWHHPLIKNEKGVSLEKINPELETQSAKSWHSASSDSQYGTPTRQNSQYRDIIIKNEESEIWCEEDVFSPNNDGKNDILSIKYKMNEIGYFAKIAIFNSNGIKIADIKNNELLSLEGTILWDGINNHNEPSSQGIYVVYVEAYHPTKGIKKTKKIPVVLSYP